MLTLKDLVPAAAKVDAELHLPYELREKSRLRATLSTGEEAALFLVRGTMLRDGDCLKGVADDGTVKIVRIVAAPEAVHVIECHDADEFARCAYHLGNRHTMVQFLPRMEDGHFVLSIRADKVLIDMIEGLGAHASEQMLPFEPEGGAYSGGGHSHAHSHDHAHDHGHDHEHEHEHEHAHGHDHGHEHHQHGHDPDLPHPGSRMPVHEPKIHRPDPAKWTGTQDK
jgi:urease accessory protein